MTPHQRAWKIGGIYAAFGFLWILLSDRVLETLVPDAITLSVMQTWKGWFYVAVTALLVVQLARRAFAEEQKLLGRSRESEDRLRTIIDSVGDVILLHDPESGRILEANSMSLPLYGYTPDEMCQMGVGDLSADVAPWRAAEALKLVHRAAAGEQPFFQWRARRKDGSLVWVDVSLRRADLAGQVVVLALVRDVSARVVSEEALRSSEERFRAFFEQAAVGVLLYDVQKHRIERANQRFCEIVGYTAEELDYVNPAEIQHPENREANLEGMAALLQGARREHRLEQRLRRRDGGLVWVDLTVSALPGEAGAPRHLVVVVQDVTVRRQAEGALRESEERYRLLFDSNPLPMWVFDRESLAFLAVNDAAVAHYGWSRAEFLAMRVSDIRPPEELPALLEALRRAPVGRDEAGVWRHYKKNGEEIQVEITSHSLDFAFHQGVLVLALDVTERLHARQQLEESEERLRLTLSATGQGLFDLNLITGIGVVNPEYALMLGYEADDLVWSGERWLALLHPEDRKEAAHVLGEYSTVGRTEHRLEFRMRTRSGSWIQILSVGRLMERDAAGHPLRLLGTQTNITAQCEVEQALKESEQRFSEILNSMHEAVFIHDAETGEVLLVNRRTCELYEVSDADVLGSSFDRFNTGEEGYGPEEAGTLLRSVRDKGPQSFEWRSRSLSGRVFWADVDLRLIQLGDQPRILAVVRDISERKAAETALLESESRYRLLFRSLSTGFALHEVVLDAAGVPVDYIFLEVNPTYEEMTGLRAADIVGRSVREVLPQVEEEWIRRFGAVAVSGVPDHFQRYSLEVDAYFDVMAYSPQPHQFAVLLRDDSELMRMVADVKQSSRRLELLHEIDGAVLSGEPAELVQRRVLERLLTLVPSPRASLVLFDEQGVGEIVCVAGDGPALQGPGSRFNLRPELLDELRHSRVVCVQAAAARPGLEGVHGELAAIGLGEFLHVPLVSQGELLGSMNLVRATGTTFSDREQEISMELACQLAVALRQHRLQEEVSRHAAELEARVTERTLQLQAANEELEAFTYSVSHDLRSPLRAVDGFSRMLAEDHAADLGPEAIRLLGVIRNSTQQMDKLIIDLLSLSRISRTELRREWVDMQTLARAVFQDVTAGEAGEPCELVLGALPPAWGDPGLLRQVWRNLLDNAVKFSRRSAVKRVEVEGESCAGLCRYRVRDQGAGFDPAYAHKLFGVFQRLHAAQEFEGTGVGLALVQRIIRRHGGDVRAEGRQDEGACFQFTLPEQGEE